MKKLTVQVGDKFNKLTVLEMKSVNEKGFSTAECRCDCGAVVTVRVAELRSGHKKTCGCGMWKAISAKRSEDIVGKRFGRLTVLSLAGADNRKYRIANCKCDCGAEVKSRITKMLCGELQSCGCLQREKAMENLATAHRGQVKHGMSGTLTGRSWLAMMQRCYNNKTCESYGYYGAKGIRVCEFLKTSPLNLVLLIGERPGVEMSLDRPDVMGMYSCGGCAECLSNGWPLNVRWATVKEQNLNKTNTRFVEIDGVTKTASEWCELLGLRKGSKKIYTY